MTHATRTVPAALLHTTLARVLIAAEGGSAERWAALLGPIEQLPATEDNSNWRVAPNATGDDLRAIKEAVGLVRKQFPYIDG